MDTYNPNAPVASVDYETFYTDEYSVSKMSYWHYCHHPLFDAYRVSIVTSDGFKWVGHPKDAPWTRIRDHNWISHNRPFDWSVHEALIEMGVVPSWRPFYWGNTINLCAWLRVPRALAKAVKVLFGITHNKKIRDVTMKGKKWAEFPEAVQKSVDVYALQDGEYCLRIWMENIHKWPTHERRIADLIDDRGLYGLNCDKAGMEADMEIMRKVLFVARSKIPWANNPDVKLLSMPEVVKECRSLKIPPPPSLAMTDEGLQEWEDKYGEKHTFVGAMRDYRRMNSILQKYETIYSRIKADGRFEFSVAYLGTHTGRTSGTDKAEERKGANMLNLPREPFYIRDDFTVVYRKKDMRAIADYRKDHDGVMPKGIAFGIDLRAKIIPAPGYKFVICDKAQIEARITNWFAKDKKTLDLVRAGISVYEAHAMALMGYIAKKGGKGLKKDQPQTYSLAKARELALGFQAGHVKFLQMAHLYIDDEEYDLIFYKKPTKSQINQYRDYLEATSQKDLLRQYDEGDEYLQWTRVQSWMQVQQYRKAKEDTLVKLWKQLDSELRSSASFGGKSTHEVELPSGRVLRYFNVREVDGSIRASVELGSNVEKYFYGGKILENAVQATARDFFVEDQLAIDDIGQRVVLDIYDEVVTEVPIDFEPSIISEIMTRCPDWALNWSDEPLPLGVDTEVSYYYKK